MEEQHFPEEEKLALVAAVLTTIRDETNCSTCFLHIAWMLYANACKLAIEAGVEFDLDEEAQRMRQMLQQVHNVIAAENADISTHDH